MSRYKDRDEGVRAHTAEALGNIVEHPEIVSALLDSLSDESAYVREFVTYALKQAMDQEKARHALITVYYSDNSDEVRIGAIESLGNAINHSDVFQVLFNAFQDRNDEIARTAIMAFRNTNFIAEVVPTLLMMLEKDERDQVRTASANVLQYTKPSIEIISALFRSLQDQSENVRRTAASSIEEIAHRATAKNIPDFPQNLLNSIGLPDLDKMELDKHDVTTSRDRLLSALLAIAPTPGEVWEEEKRAADGRRGLADLRRW